MIGFVVSNSQQYYLGLHCAEVAVFLKSFSLSYTDLEEGLLSAL